MDPVICWPTPKSIKAIRGFLGITGYYWRFINQYGQLAKSLTALLKREAQRNFQWTTEAEQSFEALKGAIISSPVLIMGDFNLPFVVECDTSANGVRAVLMLHLCNKIDRWLILVNLFRINQQLDQPMKWS